MQVHVCVEIKHAHTHVETNLKWPSGDRVCHEPGTCPRVLDNESLGPTQPSPLPESCDYRHKPPHPSFCRGLWGLSSGPHASMASPLPAEPHFKPTGFLNTMGRGAGGCVTPATQNLTSWEKNPPTIIAASFTPEEKEAFVKGLIRKLIKPCLGARPLHPRPVFCPFQLHVSLPHECRT